MAEESERCRFYTRNSNFQLFEVSFGSVAIRLAFDAFEVAPVVVVELLISSLNQRQGLISLFSLRSQETCDAKSSAIWRRLIHRQIGFP